MQRQLQIFVENLLICAVRIHTVQSRYQWNELKGENFIKLYVQ